MSKNTRRATLVNRCSRCRINTHWCFCDQIPKLKSNIEISIIMHHTELWYTSNTAYFASLVLDSCKVIPRGQKGESLDQEQFLKSDVDYLYLFPTEGSIPISNYKQSNNKVHLVVPDGSWSKAKKIHKREQAFKQMPKYHLENVGTSKYKLRKSPGENFLCTYEAIAYALSILDGTKLKDDMLDFFDIFVDRVLSSRKGDFSKGN